MLKSYKNWDSSLQKYDKIVLLTKYTSFNIN